MPEATAKRTAELLLQDHPTGEPFDVDFIDPKFTRLIVEAFEHLGCSVEPVGIGTRIRVRRRQTDA